MNVINLEDLVNDILVGVTGCPSVLAERALVYAARDWYRDTHCWQGSLPAITCFADVDTYPLKTDDCVMIIGVQAAYMDNKECKVLLLNEKKVKVLEKIKDGQLLTLSVSKSITYQATSVPCEHAQKYMDSWHNGAMWHLLSMPTQAWTNLEQAAYFRSLFRLSIAHERGEMFNGRQFGSQQVTIRSFI